MSEPSTISVLEQHATRIANELKKSVGNDTEWREKQAEQWGFVRAHIESQSHFNDARVRWEKEHQDKDDEAFEEMNTRLDARVNTMSNTVNGLSTDRERVKAVWKAAGWLVAAVTAFVTAAVWVTEKILAHFDKVQP